MWIKTPSGGSGKSTAAAPSDRGAKAERAAEHYLKARGLTLKERNYRCKLGEIDLVMLDGDAYVFVEVRFRSHRRFGSPAETVNHTKQGRLMRTAQHFLQGNGLLDKVPCRFDVVSVTGVGREPEINWIRNAF